MTDITSAKKHQYGERELIDEFSCSLLADSTAVHPNILTPIPVPTSDGMESPGTLCSVPTWSDEAVAASYGPIKDVPFVAIGGGPASFAVVDLMRICGVSARDIRVVSPQRHAYDSLRYLMYASQICEVDPLRSDSMSRAGNIWGFPSYALERAIRHRSPRPLWNVLTEPVVTDFFNPTQLEVFGGIDREARRIGWESMLIPGRIKRLLRRDAGGYFGLVRPIDGSEPFVLRSHYIHLGTGYSAVRYAPEVTTYRMSHGEYFNVVNAYEPHEHVYQVLRRRAGTVVIRGAGITASRVLQRLIDDRDDSGKAVQILHVFRNYVTKAQGPLWFRRPGGDGWNYQAFSFPKAAGAGQLRQRLFRMDSAERAAFIQSMGGTTTAKRRGWQRQLRRARAEGFYHALDAEICAIEPSGRRRVKLLLDRDAEGEGVKSIEVDFVIDCTGLELSVCDDPLISDLVENMEVSLNPLGGLDVGPHFEVRGSQSKAGQVYASGVIARGGYLAPVDSFWGFSHAALLICDDLAKRGFCARLSLVRSVITWLKLLANQEP
jgi:hypothetical protein